MAKTPPETGVRDLSSRPRHAPYLHTEPEQFGADRQSPVVRLGLRPLSPDSWLEPDSWNPAATAFKRSLLTRDRASVHRSLDGSEAGALEIEQLIDEHLSTRSPTANPAARGARAAAGAQRCEEPLIRAGLRVIDDLCLLEPRAGRHILTAAFVCSPTHWRLEEKIGLPIADIHQPVPGYEERIERSVNRILETLPANRVLGRFNWSLTGSSQSFLPVREATELERLDAIARSTDAIDKIGEALYVRVERQSLRRLARSGGVVFTIRVHSDTVATVASDAPHARGLRAAIDALTEAEAAYKGISGLRDLLLDYLGRRAGL